MFCFEMYCPVCGCAFSLPGIRDPVNPDPNENPTLELGDPYDSRFLPEEQIQWLRKFRVVGRWAEMCEGLLMQLQAQYAYHNRDPLFVNVESTPGLFMSRDAKWFYRDGLPDPEIPTNTGKFEKIPVYAHAVNKSDTESMLLPIHEACLDSIRRMCQIRQKENLDSSVHKPATLIAFCDALRQRKVKNDTDPDVSHSVDRYYGNSGGIEWPHDYYGARQFWTDEWDTEPGWELLCADPSPLKVPNIASYLLATSRDFPSKETTRATTRVQIATRLGWLVPEELDPMTDSELNSVDWDKAIPSLLQKAMENGPTAGDEEERKEGKLKPTSAPLGLQNRWRIWKILQAI